MHEVVEHILRSAPTRPSVLNASLAGDLETITLRCLAKEPERRYQTAGELARDLRADLAGEPIQARRDSAWRELRKTFDRYRAATIAACAVLAITLVFSLAVLRLYWQANQAQASEARARLTAEREAQRATNAQTSAEEQFDSNHAHVVAQLRSLVTLYERWQRPAQATPYRQRLESAGATSRAYRGPSLRPVWGRPMAGPTQAIGLGHTLGLRRVCRCLIPAGMMRPATRPETPHHRRPAV